jgi:hypothetical protein
LFSEEDKRWFNFFLSDETFQQALSPSPLSQNAQLLFIRIFQRKFRWLRQDKIKYDAISENLEPELNELVTSGYLIKGEDHLEDLMEVLELLPAPELKLLAKNQRINLKNGQSQKVELIQSLLSQSVRQKSILDFTTLKRHSIGGVVGHVTSAKGPSLNRHSFGGTASCDGAASSGHSQFLLTKGKSLLGPTFKVATEPREVFLRAMLLFDMCGLWMEALEDSSNNQGRFGIFYNQVDTFKGHTTSPSSVLLVN